MVVDGVYAHTTSFLAERRFRSVAALVDELVTLVHQNQRFRWMQPSIREILEMATPDRCAFEAFYTRNNLQYRAQPANDDFQFSAWELLSTIQQFGAIDMELDNSASLRLRSLFCSGDNQHWGQPMHLLLDGKYRIFRTFPNGCATMAATREGWAYGDYFGFLEGPHSIKLWFFAYRNRSNGNGGGSPARCISVHLTLAEAGGSWQPHCREDAADTATTTTVRDQLLHVSVKVDDAMCPPVGDDDNRDGGHQQGLMTLASGARHALWKTLHWKPRSEFEVEYQRLTA
ncbi:hypothetical protein Gpo141_00014019 [Globisporangium polare]